SRDWLPRMPSGSNSPHHCLTENVGIVIKGFLDVTENEGQQIGMFRHDLSLVRNQGYRQEEENGASGSQQGEFLAAKKQIPRQVQEPQRGRSRSSRRSLRRAE